MNHIKLGTIFLFAAILFSSALAQDNQKLKIEQTVLFEFSHINFAWGYRHHGWFIDNLGKVKNYRIKNYPNKYLDLFKKEYLSKKELEEYSKTADKIVYAINKDELFSKYLLIEPAAKGELSKLQPTGLKDAGGGAFYGYYWDKKKNKYKRILLMQYGGTKQYNLAPEAIELTRWLNRLDSKVH